MNISTKISLLIFIFLSFTFSRAASLGGKLMFAAHLDGSQEVPAVTTNANGVAGFTLNETRDSLWLNVSITGLSGVITGIHIHEGAVGVSGPVLMDLGPFLAGTLANGILTGATLTGPIISKLIKGAFYINVHTALHPNGEIRGQILPETDWAFTASLSGGQEVPPVATSARGLGTFNLAQHGGVLKFNVVVEGLSGAITGAHLHIGAMGVAGPVMLDLMPFLSGNVISGQADPTAFLAALKSGTMYINVHTSANPGGEIRGQLVLTDGFNLDATINGAQETPAVTTNAKASGAFKLSSGFDSLYYDIQAVGLSGAMTGVHFHTGAFGVAGGVTIDLTPSITGNRITGFVTGASLTTAFISNLITGNIYVNLHTGANPGGEIRGQLYRVAREPYNIVMDGKQETPPVISIAGGSGIVSIDRDETNVHFMIVATNITMTAAHFHVGAKGESGPPVLTLTSSFVNNGAFGYWKSTDATAFTATLARQFAKDSIYVNLHTTLNPNGEDRGQVTRAYNVKSAAGINNGSAFISPIEVYPNPATTEINLNIKSNVQIIDALGKTVACDLNSDKINITNLEAGLYYIIMNDEGRVYTKTFVKQ